MYKPKYEQKYEHSHHRNTYQWKKNAAFLLNLGVKLIFLNVGLPKFVMEVIPDKDKIPTKLVVEGVPIKLFS